ncbi:hypothetical protein DCS_00096 [Drechmeria coniospora]|uniref:Uncharacterized protein n=1 Tax=Drechmeria coniospora TaxID=98403 RepID=A0A151GPD0_DRECN|nr:hypothetical protein DCS_00096 [Drechmeria coniospora]KYK58969.1 hypothetical protein DCS_00096 [Drechmeria coniospora]
MPSLTINPSCPSDGTHTDSPTDAITHRQPFVSSDGTPLRASATAIVVRTKALTRTMPKARYAAAIPAAIRRTKALTRTMPKARYAAAIPAWPEACVVVNHFEPAMHVDPFRELGGISSIRAFCPDCPGRPSSPPWAPDVATASIRLSILARMALVACHLIDPIVSSRLRAPVCVRLRYPLSLDSQTP